MRFSRLLTGLFVGLLPLVALGQPELPQYNPNSIDPIPAYEQHYKLRVWRKVDLREKQNKGFFARNGEITNLILNGIKSGEIANIYTHDSLTTT
ncbi:MAG: gliding motility protein GldN, partial [Cyclobacteriaceae bacterium]|nr:gliding motility protein GldN [Cyclobacteriaceae bacterium]